MAKSLQEFIVEEQRQHGGPDISALIFEIADSCRRIAVAVNRGALSGVMGYAASENIQGETQKKLDVITNDIFTHDNEITGFYAGLASEEMDDPYEISAGIQRGDYLLVYDPLDGSSNVDVNISVGTIFSILKAPNKNPAVADFLQPGVQQLCGGYALYGSSTMMVLTTGHGVNGFTLDVETDQFVLTNPSMMIPADTAEFAINMSNRRFWEAPVQRYVEECVKGKDGGREKNFNMRWVASMVAEVHRILCRGGVFMYPFDTKDPTKAGKLRLMYEANPMSFIVEQAGGVSSTGRQRIMDIQPNGLHQRVPVILGSKNEVERVVAYHQGV